MKKPLCSPVTLPQERTPINIQNPPTDSLNSGGRSCAAIECLCLVLIIERAAKREGSLISACMCVR